MEISKKKSHWILCGIILLGLVLRVWGIDFGLPNLARPDENHISQSVIYSLIGSFLSGNPSLDPHFFYYPSFFLYVVGFFYGLYFLVGYWLGLFPDGQAFISLYQTDWTSFHLIQRFVSAVFGVASIPALYALGKQLSRSRTVGLGSAFLLAVTYLHVRDSHFGMTDITSVFWVILCLYHSVRYAMRLKTTHHKHIYLAAIFAGLAATTKYPAGFVIASVLTAFLLKNKLLDESWKKALNNQFSKPSRLIPLITILLIFIGAFFLCTPFSLLNPVEFIANLHEQSNTVNTDYFGYMLPGWRYHLQFSLWYGLGAMYLLFGLGGFLWCLYRKQTFEISIPHWAIMVFCGVYDVANASTHYVFARYAMPLVPVMAIYAAILILDVTQLIVSKITAYGFSKVNLRMGIFLLLVAVLSYSTIANSFSLNQVLSKPDTRAQARIWLMQHLKPGDGVGIGMVFTHVDLPPLFKRYFLRVPSDGYDYQAHQNHYIFNPKARLLDVSTNRNEYNLSTYSDVDFLRANGIRYVLLGRVSQPMYAIPDFEIDAVHQQKGLKKVAVFSPLPSGAQFPNWYEYDAIDGFFVPFTHPGLVNRPGPNIEIFEVLPKS